MNGLLAQPLAEIPNVILISFSPMLDPPQRNSLLLSFHSFSWRLLEALDGIARGLWAGFWLGFLSRKQIHLIDQHSYAASKSYLGTDHNLSGLYGWETEAIDRYFKECRRLVLLGAGAGREVGPLLGRGFEVDAFECHEGLRETGNALLAEHDPRCSIQSMERDLCPNLEGNYDGVIVGWGMYSLIQGRGQRIQLLRELRASVEGGTPMLLSFYVLGGPQRRYRIAARLGNIIRTVLGRERLDFGDNLSPGYGHLFTRESLEEELREAGWRLEFFDRRTYPHAVAIAEE